MNALIGVVVAIIVGVIGLAIVTQIIAAMNLTGLVATVVGFIPVMLAVGLLIMSVNWAQ